jgi:hypothetical protein
MRSSSRSSVYCLRLLPKSAFSTATIRSFGSSFPEYGWLRSLCDSFRAHRALWAQSWQPGKRPITLTNYAPELSANFLRLNPASCSLVTHSSSGNQQIFRSDGGYSQLFVGTAALAAIMIATALPAFAGLGGDLSSIEADRMHMRAARRTTLAQA